MRMRSGWQKESNVTELMRTVSGWSEWLEVGVIVRGQDCSRPYWSGMSGKKIGGESRVLESSNEWPNCRKGADRTLIEWMRGQRMRGPVNWTVEESRRKQSTGVSGKVAMWKRWLDSWT